jgi:hypothetical protein
MHGRHAPHGFVPGKPGFLRNKKCAQLFAILFNPGLLFRNRSYGTASIDKAKGKKIL